MAVRNLTSQEDRELERLNKAVKAAIAKRRKWLDAKMHECSSIKAGDRIFDLETGQCLGVVSELYRYWQDRDEGVRDESLEVDYRYEVRQNVFDNTSSYGGNLRVGTEDEWWDGKTRSS